MVCFGYSLNPSRKSSTLQYYPPHSLEYGKESATQDLSKGCAGIGVLIISPIKGEQPLHPPACPIRFQHPSAPMYSDISSDVNRADAFHCGKTLPTYLCHGWLPGALQKSYLCLIITHRLYAEYSLPCLSSTRKPRKRE